MRCLFPVLAAASVAATTGLAQEAAPDVVARLEAMTCRAFLALDAGGQATVKAALLAHASGAPLPETPLPDTPAPGAGGRVVEDWTGAPGTAAAEAAPAAETGTGIGAPEVVEGENESGKVSPDGTEASVTDEAGDRRLVAMRTSCEGGPDARALDALRAAFGNSL